MTAITLNCIIIQPKKWSIQYQITKKKDPFCSSHGSKFKNLTNSVSVFVLAFNLRDTFEV